MLYKRKTVLIQVTQLLTPNLYNTDVLSSIGTDYSPLLLATMLQLALAPILETICLYKVDILRKFKMFEFDALESCGITKEIALLNLFCFSRPKYPQLEIQTS